MNHDSLAELEEAHAHERDAARRAVDQADQRLEHYRTRMNALYETSYHFAASLGLAHHEGFRQTLQRLVDDTDEQVRDGSRTVIELEEDFGALTARQDEQREDFLRNRRP